MPVEIIAEIATNAGGSMESAKEAIRIFTDAGATTIKGQLTRVKHLQPNDPQYAWFEQAEFCFDQWQELRDYCAERGVGFLLTCYNAADVAEIVALNLRRVKIGSGEAGNEALARAICAATCLHALVSNGLGLGRMAFSWWRAQFLGCVSRYPAPGGLAAPMLLSDSRLVGWSDHSIGIEECKRAICVGAQIIEVHVKWPSQLRAARVYEKDWQDIVNLRRFADENARERYKNRWQA